MTRRDGSRRLGRSAGPQDVTRDVTWTGYPSWHIESAIRSIGPYIIYPDGTITNRRTGEIVWRPGDPPEKRPRNPEPEFYDKPHTKRRF